MQKTFLLLILGIIADCFVFNCESKYCIADGTPPFNEYTADSMQYYIMEEEIYEVIHALCANFSEGFDRNVVELLPFIPKLDETGFSPKSQIIFYPGMGGEGISQFFASKEDLQYIREQIHEYDSLQWVVSKLKGINYDSSIQVIYGIPFPNGDDWVREGKIDCIESYGLPLFNKQRDKCTIYVGAMCDELMGSGSTYFLEKKNCTWVLVGSTVNWVS